MDPVSELLSESCRGAYRRLARFSWFGSKLSKKCGGRSIPMGP